VVGLVLILATALGSVVGVGIVVRGQSFGPPVPTDAAARPTFVIAASPSPSPTTTTTTTTTSGSPRSATVPSATANDEYTVEPGDTLRSIAQQVYDDPAQWPRIYDANRETIGPDPDSLRAGTRLRIPRP
jgi:nucleoid-associated protein YgaU